MKRTALALVALLMLGGCSVFEGWTAKPKCTKTETGWECSVEVHKKLGHEEKP